MHYAVFYPTADDDYRCVESAVIVADETGFRFESGIRDFVWAAALEGRLLYFSDKKAFGLYGCLMDHPLRPRFWWVFDDCRWPERGRFKKYSWYMDSKSFANVCAAEFAVTNLQVELEKAKELDPDIADELLHEFTARLMYMFDVEMMKYCLGPIQKASTTATITMSDGKVKYMFVTHAAKYIDGSELVMDKRGYSVAHNNELEILQMDDEGMVDPRVVVLTEYDIKGLSRPQ